MRAFRPIATMMLLAVAAVGAFAFERSDAVDLYGENSVRTALKSRFAASGIICRERPLNTSVGGFGTSLVIDIAPTSSTAEEKVLVVATPLSDSLKAAGAPPDYGVEAAAALAERVTRDGAPVRVVVAFTADEYSRLDGAGAPTDEKLNADWLRLERGQSAESAGLLGLRDLVSLFDLPERVIVLYLDLPGRDPHPALLQGSDRTLTPLAVAAAVQDAFAVQRLQLRAATPFMELYRLGLVDSHPALSYLNQKGFQATLFQSDRRNHPPPTPAANDFAAALYSFAQTLPELPAESERNYAIVPLGFWNLRLSELTIVFLLIASIVVTAAALFIYSIVRQRTMRARWIAFRKRSWAIPVFLAVLSLCYYAAGHFLRWSIVLRGMEFDESSVSLALVRLLLAGVLYALISPWITRYPFPRRAHFYGASAVLFLSMGMAVAALLDISFVPAFMWAVFFALAAAATRFHRLTYLFAALSPLPLAAACLTAGFSGNSTLIRLLLSNDWRIAVFIAFIILPFFFLFRRILILSRNRRGRASETWYARLLSAGAAALVAIAAIGRYEAPPRPVAVNERFTAETASAKLGGQVGFSVKINESIYLDRRSLRLRLSPAGRPERIDLSLDFDSPAVIYDAPLPYSYSGDRKTVDFTLGERPPLPLELEIVLPAALSGRLRAEAVYLEAPWPRLEATAAEAYRLTISGNATFGPGR